MSEEKKFEGATFISKFCISRKLVESCALGSKQLFREVVKNALRRVEYDLVEEMMLKNSDENGNQLLPIEISNEQIEKFLQHGIKITIIGEVKDVIQDEEYGKYSMLLIKLHKLFQEARDETEEGDAIREEMYDIWKNLNEKEQNKGRELSIALKTHQTTPLTTNVL